MIRFVHILVSIVVLTSALSPLQARAETGSEVPVLTPPLKITEIYPNGPGTSEVGYEYIRLTNEGDQTLSLLGYSLSIRKDGDQVLLPENISLPPGFSIIIYPIFGSLLNGGETITLHPPETEYIAQSVTYPGGIKEDESWLFTEATWQKQNLTGDALSWLAINLNLPPVEETTEDNDLPEEELEETENSINQPTCVASTIEISEIVANPSGVDSAGGEFIELHNSGNETIHLDDCFLSTDKQTAIVLEDISVLPGEYYSVTVYDALLNGGGTVLFSSDQHEHEVKYPTLKDDESWSVIGGVWQFTTVMTPGAPNKPTPVEVTITSNHDNSLEPCPDGKFRNPETNRCKNITDSASSLLPCPQGSTRNPDTNRCRKLSALSISSLTPCKPGQTRNPETNRCRSVSTSSSSLKPCTEGQERNPETNRCRKITASSSELKPCEDGYERNPETNRCRKSAAVLSGATIQEPPATERGLHSGIMIIMTLLAIAYAIYEYRLDFANFYQEKLKHKKFKTLIGRKADLQKQG